MLNSCFQFFTLSCIHTLCHVTFYVLVLKQGYTAMLLNSELGHMKRFDQWDGGGNNSVPVSSLGLMRPRVFHLPFALLSSS